MCYEQLNLPPVHDFVTLVRTVRPRRLTVKLEIFTDRSVPGLPPPTEF